ncbi:MAG: ABC transporter transmembrane domain-containing protein [Pseudonocardia sp.]
MSHLTAPLPATGTPDTRGPLHLLWWVVRSRLRLPLLAVAAGAVWTLPGALLPFVLGDAIDGWTRSADLLPSFVAVLALVLLQAAAGGGLHRAASLAGLHARSIVHRVLIKHVTTAGAGHRSPPGELIAIATTDALSIEGLVESLGRALGSFVGLAIIVTVLLVDAPLLGAVMVVGTVLAVLGIGPLLRPIRERSEKQRAELGRATAAAVDVVSGLRVLRGIGGEQRFGARFARISQEVRRTGVHAGRSEARLMAVGVLLPGLITVAVTWLGARFVIAGTIPVGDVVAAFGASGFLYLMITNLVTTADIAAVAAVGAERICVQLRRPPAPPSSTDMRAHPALAGPGLLTVVPAGGQRARDLARDLGAGARHGRAAGTVLLSGPDDVLFSGPVGQELRVARPAADPGPALDAAAARDVVEHVLGGADGHLDPGGRSLSGGQRQRLLLARALHADVDVLILDDPTGAVDAYTESLICPAVARLRRGRTTVVISESGSWLARADRTVRLDAPLDTGTPTSGPRS